MVRLFLELSTAHISKVTADWLNEQGVIAATAHQGHGRRAAIHVASFEEGWLVYAHEDAHQPAAPHEETPDDLWRCMVYARSRGAEFLLFYDDTEIVNTLPIYM